MVCKTICVFHSDDFNERTGSRGHRKADRKCAHDIQCYDDIDMASADLAHGQDRDKTCAGHNENPEPA